MGCNVTGPLSPLDNEREINKEIIHPCGWGGGEKKGLGKKPCKIGN